MKYLEDVAKLVARKYGHDYYEALNVAECLTLCGREDEDAIRIFAILEGEL